LKAKGMPVRRALLEAGCERLQPILMTTIAMVSGAGAEWKNGMG
jgi:HAE1 family hydrophobic/amphiphilic exporter-1